MINLKELAYRRTITSKPYQIFPLHPKFQLETFVWAMDPPGCQYHLEAGGLWKTFVRGTGISILREPAPTTRLTLKHRQPLHCCSLASALSKSQVTTRKHRHSQCLPATKVNHNRQFDHFDARRWLLSTGDEEILPESHMKILTAFSLKELKGDYWLVVVQNLRSLKNSGDRHCTSLF